MGTQYATRNYYRDEERVYRYSYAMEIPDADVEYVVRKLTIYFNKYKKKNAGPRAQPFVLPHIRFYGHRQSGSAGGWKNEIRLSHRPSMGLIIHEFAHLTHSKGVFREVLKKHVNKGTSHHGSHFEICLRRVHEYAKSRGYWEQVVKNRIYRRINKS